MILKLTDDLFQTLLQLLYLIPDENTYFNIAALAIWARKGNVSGVSSPFLSHNSMS